MQHLIRISCLILFFCQALFLSSQDIPEFHLLDGSAVEYEYDNGGAVKAEFKEGKYVYKWIAGPFAGSEGASPYRSMKVDDQLYIVNILVEENGSFATFLFNFDRKRIFTSALLMPGTEQESVLMDKGTIRKFVLKE